MSAAELVTLAAAAKTKIKASARAWSMLSRAEIEALAFVADVFLEDAVLPPKPDTGAHLPPVAISET